MTEPDPTHATGATRDEQEREVKKAREERVGGEPHGELSNPARDPDPTEYPDPYDKRPDPRGPDAAEDPAPKGPSTSEPRPSQNVDRHHYEGDER
jgi:hypothetical protein